MSGSSSSAATGSRGASLQAGSRPGRSFWSASLLSLALAACGGGGGPEEAGAAPAAQAISGDTLATAPAAATSAAAAGTTSTSGAGGTPGTDSHSAGGTGTASVESPAAAGSTVAQLATIPNAGSVSATATVASTATRQDAFRLLTQASFGPTSPELAKVMAGGNAAWLDSQMALPSSASYVARWDASQVLALATSPNGSAGATPVSSQFFQQALVAPDQLRGRVAYALSQIFVVSTQGLLGDRGRAVASYMDMLSRDAFGNYRALLQDVALHPAMGLYLSSLKNQKENPLTGQIPDQNFAREVMQLFSIGLAQLNADGTLKRDANGAPLETYSGNDIVGLSKVFTGFSYGGADTGTARFAGSARLQDANRFTLPMQAYPAFHSTSEKNFLGATVPAQGTPDPAASLKTALDTLARHPNVGPFIGRQLIQRLVTSHPSNAYVGRVAAVFDDNGAGVRGDLKAVVRAILLDDEARNPTAAAGDAYGKVREPVLRLTAWMRAFNARSDSGAALVANTDDPGLALGQSAGRAGSVFNFYRPGFIAAGSETGARNLTMPELQITSETSVAGYVNFMATAVAKGVGLKGIKGTGTRPDVQPDYTAELALAASSTGLVDLVTAKLLGDGVPDAFKAQIRGAVESIPVPALKATANNQAQVSAALANRVYAAILLTLASPEFIVQK